MAAHAAVEPLSDERAGWFTRLVYWFARKKLRSLSSEAPVPSSLRVMAHHRGVMLTSGAFEVGLERCQRVPMRLKALAGIRAATLIGCPF
jgi:hypothetical protein